MTRPLTSREVSGKKRREYFAAEERRARETRGERGQMESALRLTRARISQDVKSGRTDVFAGFALICQLFHLAMDKRAAGDGRLWDDLLRYAHQVVERHNTRK